jgi:hypothetical protein
MALAALRASSRLMRRRSSSTTAFSILSAVSGSQRRCKGPAGKEKRAAGGSNRSQERQRRRDGTVGKRDVGKEGRRSPNARLMYTPPSANCCQLAFYVQLTSRRTSGCFLSSTMVVVVGCKLGVGRGMTGKVNVGGGQVRVHVAFDPAPRPCTVAGCVMPMWGRVTATHQQPHRLHPPLHLNSPPRRSPIEPRSPPLPSPHSSPRASARRPSSLLTRPRFAR